MYAAIGFALFVSTVAGQSRVRVNVCRDQKDSSAFRILENQDCDQPIAAANFTNSVNTTGWGVLEISTSAAASDYEQAYAAGLAEGHATSELMAQHWYNTYDTYCNGAEEYCEKLWNYSRANLKWVLEQANQNKDTYWHLTKLMILQLAGLQDGYKGKTVKKVNTDIDVKSVLMFQQIGEVDDLEAKFHKPTHLRIHKPGLLSCTGLVKVVKNNLYFAHVAWNLYNTMLRVLKHYNFAYRMNTDKNSPLVPGYRLSMSSYPGYLMSLDDFVLTSGGVAYTETTYENFNNSLYTDGIRATLSVPEWIRVMVASRLAKSAQQWSSFFSRYNSGTYNNQWLIASFGKAKSSRTLPRTGLFYVLEQLPGHIHYEDMTKQLLQQGYWPSYNIPYFPSIFNLSEGITNVKKFGQSWTYENNPRAKMMRRDVNNKVTDLVSMRNFMRYNDYKHDPAAIVDCQPPNSASNGISARADLNPLNMTCKDESMGFNCFGGLGVKVTDIRMFSKLQFWAESGPTHDDLPAFQWSTSPCNNRVRHMGHPDYYAFDRVIQEWNDHQF